MPAGTLKISGAQTVSEMSSMTMPMMINTGQGDSCWEHMRGAVSLPSRQRSPALIAAQLLGKWRYMKGSWSWVVVLFSVSLCVGLLCLAALTLHVMSATKQSIVKMLSLSPVDPAAIAVTELVEAATPEPGEGEPGEGDKPSLEAERLAFYNELDAIPLDTTESTCEAEVCAMSEEAWGRLCGVVGEGRTPEQVFDFAERELELLLMDPALAALIEAESLEDECDAIDSDMESMGENDESDQSEQNMEQKQDGGCYSFDVSETDGAAQPLKYAIPTCFLTPVKPQMNRDSDSDSSAETHLAEVSKAETCLAEASEISTTVYDTSNPPDPATPIHATPPARLKQRKLLLEGDESPNCIMAL